MSCEVCKVSFRDSALFSLPGAWDGALCIECALCDPSTAAAFREHFGEVRHVSDGDRGKGIQKT